MLVKSLKTVGVILLTCISQMACGKKVEASLLGEKIDYKINETALCKRYECDHIGRFGDSEVRYEFFLPAYIDSAGLENPKRAMKVKVRGEKGKILEMEFEIASNLFEDRVGNFRYASDMIQAFSGIIEDENIIASKISDCFYVLENYKQNKNIGEVLRGKTIKGKSFKVQCIQVKSTKEDTPNKIRVYAIEEK